MLDKLSLNSYQTAFVALNHNPLAILNKISANLLETKESKRFSIETLKCHSLSHIFIFFNQLNEILLKKLKPTLWAICVDAFLHFKQYLLKKYSLTHLSTQLKLQEFLLPSVNHQKLNE